MNWESIILAVLGLGFVGDIIMRFIFKSDRRVADAKADVAESEAAKAAVEVRKAIEEAHTIACRHYEERLAEQHKQAEERLAEMHGTVVKLDEQLAKAVQRDAEKEARYDEQTQKLREVQAKYANVLIELTNENKKNTEYEKRIGELELELERKRCDRRRCPFRLPPNAETPSSVEIDITEYFKEENQ